jgi:two-component system, sensor histidine kinase and response regulator
MRSVSSLLLKRVMSVYLTLTLLLFAFEVALQYQKARQDISEELALVQSAFSDNVRLALWNFNDVQMQASLQSIRQMPGVTRVIVTLPNGSRVRDVAGTGAHKSHLPLLPNTLYSNRQPVFGPEGSGKQLLGELEIQSNSHVVVLRILDNLLIAAAKLLVGTALLLWLVKVNFDRMLTRPLLDVARRAEAVRPHEPNAPIPVKPGEPDELDLISIAINGLVAEMAQTLGTLDLLNKDLEATVERRTQALVLTNADLMQSMQALEETQVSLVAATEAKSQFLANMSHEIRTPMNAIIGLAGLALRHELPERTRDYVGKIQHSGQHLLGIVNDILDFSKVESGKLAIETVPFALDTVIQNMVNLVGQKLEAKGLALRLEIAPDVPAQLLGDPLRIGQVLINYVNNAAKFTERGEVRVGVVLTQQDGAQLTLRFSVTDTGIGLRPEQMENLFQSFAQADASITRQYGGTGLGLAISKRLAQAMGGEVGVHSRYGEGSTFWFSVRLHIGQPQAAGTASAYAVPHSALEAGLATIAGARLLLVEDNEVNQLVATELLRSQQFEVEVADNGQLALDAVRAHAAQGQPFDLVLMDMQMPVMDGVTAARRIRESLDTQTLPIVAMTANAMAADRERCRQAGMNGFVTKPIDPDALWRALLQWVAPRPGLGVVAAPPPAVQAPGPTGPAQDSDPDLQATLQALRGVAALDVDAGLQRMAGSAVLYTRLLRKFVQSQTDSAQRMAEALEQGDNASAERIAHTLKGVAGNLGAVLLQQHAGVLEESLRKGQAPQVAQSALQVTGQSLHALASALRPLIAQPAAAMPQSQPLSAAQQQTAAALLQEVRQLLQADDAAAQDLWSSQRALLHSLLPQAAQVDAAMEDYDFERALALLDASILGAPRAPNHTISPGDS